MDIERDAHCVLFQICNETTGLTSQLYVIKLSRLPSNHRNNHSGREILLFAPIYFHRVAKTEVKLPVYVAVWPRKLIRFEGIRCCIWEIGILRTLVAIKDFPKLKLSRWITMDQRLAYKSYRKRAMIAVDLEITNESRDSPEKKSASRNRERSFDFMSIAQTETFRFSFFVRELALSNWHLLPEPCLIWWVFALPVHLPPRLFSLSVDREM